MSTQEIVDNACIILGSLTQIDNTTIERYIDICNISMRSTMKILNEILNDRIDVTPKDLDKISEHLNFIILHPNTTLSGARDTQEDLQCTLEELNKWIEERYPKVGFEYVDDYYGDCSSSDVQAVMQKKATESSDAPGLENWEIINTSTEAETVGTDIMETSIEVAGADDELHYEMITDKDFANDKLDGDVNNYEINHLSLSAIEADDSSLTDHGILGNVYSLVANWW